MGVKIGDRGVRPRTTTYLKVIVTLVVILIMVIVLLLLWNPQLAKRSEDAAPLSSNAKPIVWDDHLGHAYSGSGASLTTSAFQIGVKNNLGHEITLERVYAVSGEGAGEKELEIAADGDWVPAVSLHPLGDQQTFVIRINFSSEPARTVFENWKTFQISLIYNDGQIDRKNVTEGMVRSVYANFKPSPIGPQVRLKE